MARMTIVTLARLSSRATRRYCLGTIILKVLRKAAEPRHLRTTRASPLTKISAQVCSSNPWPQPRSCRPPHEQWHVHCPRSRRHQAKIVQLVKAKQAAETTTERKREVAKRNQPCRAPATRLACWASVWLYRSPNRRARPSHSSPSNFVLTTADNLTGAALATWT